MGICAAVLVAMYVVLPMISFLSVGRVAGLQSFVRPVIFGALGLMAYQGFNWARWFLVAVCVYGSMLWFWQVGLHIRSDLLNSAAFLAGGGIIALIALILAISDDVGAWYSARASSRRKYGA